MKTTRKLYLITVICAICMLFSFTSSAQAASAVKVNRKADAKFNSKVQTIRKNSQFMVQYKYVDVTGDGIHEAVVEYKPKNMGGSAQKCDVYAYKNGKVKRILSTEEYGLTKCIFYKKSGSLIFYGSGHGGEWYSYYKLKSNGTYKYVAERSRQALAGGGMWDGPWQYYSADKKITVSKFNSLTRKLQAGKKSSFSNWNKYY